MNGNSLYYNKKAREEVGLVLIDILDESDYSYGYNTLLVFHHTPSGRMFWTQDSGCSCPAPFEDDYFKSPDDTNFAEITRGDSYENFVRIVNNFPDTFEYRNGMIQKVKGLL